MGRGLMMCMQVWMNEAKELTGIKVKKDLVHEALRVLILVRSRKPIAELKGRVKFRVGYDPKAMRGVRGRR